MVAAVAAELTVFGIYMATGDGPGFWFLILQNLNLILFPKIYTWGGWVTWGILGMFMFVTFIGECIYIIAKMLTQPGGMPGSVAYRNKLFTVLTVGLLVGLGLGVAISAFVIGPKEVLCIVNPVQVTGMVRGSQFGSIQFVDNNEAETTRYKHISLIKDGNYSIVLSGGQSYTVYIGTGQTSASGIYSLYVPENVTTLKANFPP